MKIKLITFTFIFITGTVFGQIEDKEKLIRAYKRLDSLDVRSLRTNRLLNKGFFFGQNLEVYERFRLEPDLVNFTTTSPEQWKSIYRGVIKSGIREEADKPIPDFKEALSEFKRSDNENRIPIGVLHARGHWMQNYEVNENIQAKKKGYRLSKAYKTLDLFNASVLRRKVYSGTVNFEVIPELFLVDGLNKRIKKISIDLSDGQGFRSISSGDVVSASYDATGEKAIAIKFELPNKSFTCYSVIEVVTLEKEQPDYIFEVSASSVNGRTSALNGGTATLYAGCDDIFDQPVIIIEGFDPLNQENVYDIRASYTRADIEFRLRSNDYDVIYLDFANGGADIRTNARVLQDLIRDVNTQKQGNESITIIGESMGGLVARWALRDMEQRGQPHEVSHFISFDSPHLGANVPVGFQRLLDDINDVTIRDIFNIGQGAINEARNTLNSVAARQMLLRYKGSNPHSDFTTLQNEFNSMGWPQQNGIRNISIVNGAIDGDRQAPTNNYDPNDILFKVDWVGTPFFLVPMSVFVKVRTNKINSSGKVSSLWILTGGVPTTIKERSHSFNAFNYDISSGGWDTYSSQGLGNLELGFLGAIFNFAEWFGSTATNQGRPNFSFVPLFSSTASTAPRNNQNDLNRTVANLQANNWTPFDAIYGHTENTEHISTESLAIQAQWEILLRNELNAENDTWCTGQTAQTAPTPRINTSYWYKCELDRSSKRIYISNPSDISNLYTHQWRATGPSTSTGGGDQFYFGSSIPGTYTITATRNYSGGVSGPSSSYSRVFTVFNRYHPTYGCSEGDDNDGDGRPDPIARIASTEETDQDSIRYNIHNLKVWPNPVSGELHVAYELVNEGDVTIKLIPINSTNFQQTIITDSFRPSGVYEETFYTDHLPNGYYQLIVQTNKEILEQKIILK